MNRNWLAITILAVMTITISVEIVFLSNKINKLEDELKVHSNIAKRLTINQGDIVKMIAKNQKYIEDLSRYGKLNGT